MKQFVCKIQNFHKTQVKLLFESLILNDSGEKNKSRHQLTQVLRLKHK